MVLLFIFIGTKKKTKKKQLDLKNDAPDVNYSKTETLIY